MNFWSYVFYVCYGIKFNFGIWFVAWKMFISAWIDLCGDITCRKNVPVINSVILKWDYSSLFFFYWNPIMGNNSLTFILLNCLFIFVESHISILLRTPLWGTLVPKLQQNEPERSGTLSLQFKNRSSVNFAQKFISLLVGIGLLVWIMIIKLWLDFLFHWDFEKRISSDDLTVYNLLCNDQLVNYI